MLALDIPLFLVALVCSPYPLPFELQLRLPQDKTILATAIPRITDDFNSLSDIGWYGSSYMLSLCAFQLLWGRIYTFYPAKATYIASVLIFEIGSALGGAAPSSTSFIIGRAIAGLGSAGINNGAIVVMMESVPLEKRPVFQGLIGAVFGVASVVGPLLGGLFTSHLSWRWCFYINLPFGAVAVAALLILLRLPPKKRDEMSLIQHVKKLDPPGTILFLASVVCLLVALQWGGITYSWSNWRIILLLVLFPILLAAFLAVQIMSPETATIPMRILTQRSVAAGMYFSTTSLSSMLVLSYYIPLFFQALKNFSPVKSGEATIPFVLALVIGTIMAGGMVQRLGYPAPFMILSTIISSIGAGMISTWPVSVASNRWIGYQVIFGFGIGVGMQQPMMMAQIVLPRELTPMGVSLMFVGQNLGGAIFLAVGQAVFAYILSVQLTKIPGLHLSSKEIVEMGATTIKKMVHGDQLEVLLEGYRIAIRGAFYVALGLACASLVGAVLVEWRSVKEGEKTLADGEGNGRATEEKASV